MAKAKKTAVKKKKKPSVKKPSVAQRIAKAKKDMEDSMNSFIRQGEKLFKEAVKELFKKNPKLQSFSWDEYTPHFNDGDECVFSTHFDSMRVNEEEDPECLYTLESINKLLSNKKKSEARIIMELADTSKDKWEIESLKRDLETLKTRDPEQVSELYKMKKSVYELLSNIDDSVYQDMFGEGTVTVTRDGITVEECEHD
jgi:hypothetical protein